MKTLSPFISFVLVSLLLTGCAPGHLLVKEADLRLLEVKMQEQEERLESLSMEQVEIRIALLESHQEVSHQLQSIGVKQGEQMQRQKEWESLIRSTRLNTEAPKQAEARHNTRGTASGDKQVIGSVEKVFLSPPGAVLPARIDTGATTSSLHAEKIEIFERNGERWVRFTVINPEDDEEIALERKVVRKARIIQAVADEAERRPVVELGVTIGKSTQTAQFTLSDRRHLEFPVLIGRNILMDIMVVDVSQSHIAPPAVPSDIHESSNTP